MNEETSNMAIRKCLKQVGVSSQCEIEDAVIKAIGSVQLNEAETFNVTITLTVPEIGLNHTITGKIT